jgi:large subunit ribosomal protein L30
MARAKVAAEAGAFLEVRQVRSSIGAKPKHRGTLRALGLGRVGRSSVLPDRPEILGMVARVPHLVEVRPLDRAAAGKVKEELAR